MTKLATWLGIAVISVGTSACATWDHMSSRERSTVGGAAVGGVVGAAVSDGSVLGTVGGAAIGGIIGDQLGRDGRRR